MKEQYSISKAAIGVTALIVTIVLGALTIIALLHIVFDASDAITGLVVLGTYAVGLIVGVLISEIGNSLKNGEQS